MCNLYNGHKIRFVNGYPAIYIDKDHTTVYIHILEMEKHLGRKLKPEEVVHHCDEDRSNYSIDNLWCFETTADHTAYHDGNRAIINRDGVYYCPNKYKLCPICGKQIDYSSNMCFNCYNEKRNKESNCPQKDDLLNLLKSNNGNFKKVSTLFNVSDNTVRKWCKKHNISFHSCDYKNK